VPQPPQQLLHDHCTAGAALCLYRAALLLLLLRQVLREGRWRSQRGEGCHASRRRCLPCDGCQAQVATACQELQRCLLLV
jgi:hypothetical protein